MFLLVLIKIMEKTQIKIMWVRLKLGYVNQI